MKTGKWLKIFSIFVDGLSPRIFRSNPQPPSRESWEEGRWLLNTKEGIKWCMAMCVGGQDGCGVGGFFRAWIKWHVQWYAFSPPPHSLPFSNTCRREKGMGKWEGGPYFFLKKREGVKFDPNMTRARWENMDFKSHHNLLQKPADPNYFFFPKDFRAFRAAFLS